MKNQSISIFQNNKMAILKAWTSGDHIEQWHEDLMTSTNRREDAEELLTALLAVLSDENIDIPRSADFQQVIEILNSISISQAKHGFSPRDTGIYILSLKEALNHAMQREIVDPVALRDQTLKVGKLIDSFSVSTFEAFIKGREEVIRIQTAEIGEISTPVIQVWDGILALPIVGTLDSSRTMALMETLLQEVVKRNSYIAIMDISGVPAVDSLVAQHLIKTVTATRLMGGECIISGVRAEIAQTVTHLGIDLSTVITKSTLASALKAAFSMLNLRVERKSKLTELTG